MEPPDWTTPRQLAPPAPGEVHLWRARLDASADAVDLLLTMLAEDEQARAARQRAAAKRAEFIQARAALRTILGRYLQTPPRALAFRYSPEGKPFLPEPAALRFNLAHSNGWAVLGVSGGPELGVDIERIEPARPHLTLAQRFFSPPEAQALATLDPPGQAEAFYRCWTCKEAWVKARGTGMHFPLSHFTVALEAGMRAALIAVRDAPDECGQWQLHNFAVSGEHIAACAVRANRARWRFLHYARE